ncbi:hypothetical protein D6D03_09310 [Aureobasidium pullulans]|nr:hypothetical protein D6D03_09310 [Aureobasidium pullulans]
MLRSLLSQLGFRSKEAADQVQKQYEACRRDGTSATIKQLSATLKTTLHRLSSVTIVIDALDECDSPKDVIAWLKNLHEEHIGSLHLLITSQKYGLLDDTICCWSRQDQLYCIGTDDVDQDIRRYVHARLFQTEEFQHWIPHGNLREEVENRILEQVNGMFRLAACQLDELSKCLDRPRLMVALDNLPESLQEIYNRILGTIVQSQRHRETLLLLQFLTWSEEPLTIGVMVDAITVRLGDSPAFKKENRLFQLKHIILDCSSLVSVVSVSELHQQDSAQQQIHLAHSSVKEYLRSPNLAEPFDQHVEEVYARGLIARTCISYLISLPVEHFWYPAKEEFPFTAVASSWMEHAKAAEATDDALVQLILQLYRSEHARLGTISSSSLLDAGVHSRKYSKIRVSRSGRKYPSNLLWESPLQHGSYWGLQTVVRILLEACADVNPCNSNDSPLFCASRNGHVNVVRLLLENNANVNGNIDETNQIPLLAASSGGHLETARLLVQHGASIYARSSRRGNGFTSAAKHCHIELLRFLLEQDLSLQIKAQPVDQGQRLSVVDKDLSTNSWRLDYCVHQELLRRLPGRRGKALLLRPKDPICTHWCLQPALKSAMCSGSLAAVEMLLEHGAVPSGCRHVYNGETRPLQPLRFVIRNVMGSNFGRTINLLRAKGAEFDARTFREDILRGLEWRARRGTIADVESLLELAADVTFDTQELTHVRVLAMNCNSEVADLLLELGAKDVSDELSVEDDTPEQVVEKEADERFTVSEISQSGDQSTLKEGSGLSRAEVKSWVESQITSADRLVVRTGKSYVDRN